jgi:hypothetical protein
MTDLSPETVERMVAKLTKPQLRAVQFLPPPADAVPYRHMPARPYGSTWRKGAVHYVCFLQLEQLGIVQQRQSLGETLWRLTKPLGLAVRTLTTSTTASDGRG